MAVTLDECQQRNRVTDARDSKGFSLALACLAWVPLPATGIHHTRRRRGTCHNAALRSAGDVRTSVWQLPLFVRSPQILRALVANTARQGDGRWGAAEVS
jgi:hypothetical protein